jgi:hypothetical protein
MSNCVIWKTVLELTDIQEIEVPEGAETLIAMEQYGQVCVWFKCDPDRPRVQRQIEICGTGHNTSTDAKYLGTCILVGGDLVLHVFEHTQP